MAMALRSLAPDWFLDPLEILAVEHERQLEFVDRLIELTGELQLDLVRNSAEGLISFLTVDLALHHKDEEDDLFPILRELCSWDEGIDHILAELDRDHAVERFLSRSIVRELKTITGGKTLENPMCLVLDLRAFAKSQRRHLIWEESVVLPLARKQLGPEHLRLLGRNMAARRGLASSD